MSLREKEQSPPKLPISALARTKGGISLVGTPNLRGVDSPISSLTALLVVSVCLKEVCPLPVGKTDFLQPVQTPSDYQGPSEL